MKKIQKYNMHLFAFLIMAGIGLTNMGGCNPNPYKKFGCPCVIHSKEETVKGKVIEMITQDNDTIRILDNELYKRNIGDIVD